MNLYESEHQPLSGVYPESKFGRWDPLAKVGWACPKDHKSLFPLQHFRCQPPNRSRATFTSARPSSRLHPPQDVPHITFKMTKRTKKVGVTYVSPSRCDESSAEANIATAVNTVPGKLSRRNSMPEAFRIRLLSPGLNLLRLLCCPRLCFPCRRSTTKRCIIDLINSTQRIHLVKDK